MPAPDNLPKRQWSGLFGPRAIDLVLSGDLVLQKNVEVPRKSRRHADQILKLKADALGAGSRNNLAYVANRAGRTSSADTYQISHVRRDDIGALRKQLATNGYRVRHIFVKGPKGPNPLPSETMANASLFLWWFGAFTCLAIGFIGLWAQLSHNNQDLQQGILAAQTELVSIQNEIATARDRNAAVNAEVEQLHRLQVQFQTDQAILTRLLDITNALPDSAWLVALSFDSGEARLQGATREEATVAIEALTALPWVETATLTAPITTDRRRGTQHYELILKLQGEP